MGTKELIKQIIEKTDVFHIIGEANGHFHVWDKWETEHRINTEWPIEKVVKMISNQSYKDGLFEGESRVQREIKNALGIEK